MGSELPAILTHDDHACGCQGREYACTCGYDDRVAAFLCAQEEQIAELHRAILGGEPDYSMLTHKSFIEMVKMAEEARTYALARADQAELTLAAQEEQIERLREALGQIKWRSADKDNMEFSATITCWQMDAIRAALTLAKETNDGQ